MNDDARSDGVVGGALKLVGAGTAIYGAHRGLMSDTVGNFATPAEGKDPNIISKGLTKYRENVPGYIDNVKNVPGKIKDWWSSNPKDTTSIKKSELLHGGKKRLFDINVGLAEASEAPTKALKEEFITNVVDKTVKNTGISKKLKAVTKAL